MKYLDKEFINMLAPRLDRFTWSRDTVAQFRCPLCNDSQKSKHKRRGYFFYDYDKDVYLFKCHNCHEKSGWSFEFWLRDFDESLYKEYIIEKFKANATTTPGLKPLAPLENSPKKDSPRQSVRIGGVAANRDESLLGDMIRLDFLPPEHIAVRYFHQRKLPEYALKLLYYTKKFRDDLLEFEKDEEKHRVIPNDERLVIPFWTTDGRLKLVQGRAFDTTNRLRYVTVKPHHGDTKIYGEDRVDYTKNVLVVEGPLDSLFLPNCIATADADLLSAELGTIFIPDNQYRNLGVRGVIDKIIAAGKQVVLFPKGIPYKDINDMIKDGNMSQRDVCRILATNVYQGLKARLRFAEL